MNALQTMVGVIRAMYKKCVQLSSFDLVNFLIGFDWAEHQISMLVGRVNSIFSSPSSPTCLNGWNLQLLLTMVSGRDNVSTNTPLEFLQLNGMLEFLCSLLTLPRDRARQGGEAMMVLSLLVEYKKY